MSSMDDLGKLLKKKARDIDLDQKQLELAAAKAELKRFFDTKQAQVVSVSEDAITLSVRSSVIASELRMSQLPYLRAVSKSLNRKLTRIIIRTGMKV